MSELESVFERGHWLWWDPIVRYVYDPCYSHNSYSLLRQDVQKKVDAFLADKLGVFHSHHRDGDRTCCAWELGSGEVVKLGLPVVVVHSSFTIGTIIQTPAPIGTVGIEGTIDQADLVVPSTFTVTIDMLELPFLGQLDVIDYIEDASHQPISGRHKQIIDDKINTFVSNEGGKWISYLGQEVKFRVSKVNFCGKVWQYQGPLHSWLRIMKKRILDETELKDLAFLFSHLNHSH